MTLSTRLLREFRFAPRLRALSTDPTRRIDHEIAAGFPHLPPGCFIRLERVAEQRVLENIRETLALRRTRRVADLRDLVRHLGRAPLIREALDYLGVELHDLLRGPNKTGTGTLALYQVSEILRR